MLLQQMSAQSAMLNYNAIHPKNHKYVSMLPNNHRGSLKSQIIILKFSNNFLQHLKFILSSIFIC